MPAESVMSPGMQGPSPKNRTRLIVILALLGVLALASAAGILWVARTLRTPEFRDELARMVQQATGRTVAVDGELEVSVFPWLGFSAHGLVLGNAEGFPGGPMLRAKTLSARIKVLPLLSRELAFDTVELIGANLELYVDAEGRANWDSLLTRAKAQEAALADGGGQFRRFSVRGLAISGGAARLKDEKHNQELALSELSLRTGRIASGQPLPFTLNCDLDWPRPGLMGRIQLTGKLDPDPARAKVPLTEASVVAEVTGRFLPKSAPRAGFTAALALEEGRHLRLTDLRLKALGVDVSGELTFQDVLDTFRMSGKLAAERFDPAAVLNAYWPYAVSPQHRGALRQAEGRVDIKAHTGGLEFANLSAVVDGARVQGRVDLGFDERPTLNFDLKADRLDVDAYAQALQSNSTEAPLVGDDMPMAYLGAVSGQGRVRAEALKLAGVSAQGAEVDWNAGGGTHRLTVRPSRGEGGIVSAEASVTFAEPGKKGGGSAPVLGLTASVRMDGVAARQISWANTPDFTLTGRADLRARAELPKTPIAPQTRIGQVLRKLSGEAQASIPQAVMEWPQRAITAQGRSAAPAQRMAFSALSAQLKLTPAPGPAAGDEGWAGQADFGLSATGTKPALTLEAKGSGQVRTAHRAQGLKLANASVSGRLKGWFLPARENEAVFSARGALDFRAETLTLAGSSVQGWGLNLVGPGTVTRLFSREAALSARVRCQDSDPRRFLAALDLRAPKSADKRALVRMSGEADLLLSSKGLQLNNLAAQFDDTQVRGSYGFTNFDDPQQRFAFQATFLDLDRYYPDAPKRGPNDPRPAPEPLDVEALRELDAEGTLQFRGLKYAGLVARNFKATLTAHGGTLNVRPVAGEFYGGSVSGEFTAQAQGRAVQTRLALAAKDFALSPFMIGWAGKEYATGRADLFVDVTGSGATDQEVLRTLEGLASFKVLDGSYVLSGAQERPAAGQGGQRRPPSATGQSGGQSGGQGGGSSSAQGGQGKPGTPFHQAEARFKVHRGVFASDDFRLEAPTVMATGKGSFSLPDETIAFNLTARMTGLPDVPIRVHGRLRDPEMDIPPGVLINNTIKELLGLPFKPIKFFKDLLF